MRWPLHPRLTIDASFRDVRFALSACARTKDAERAARHAAESLEAAWAPADGALAALSVRSAFSLYLSALDLPQGSEVLLSAVTIPDMPRLVREHGLVPVPVDIDPFTLAPRVVDAERAWSGRSRVFVVAHLLGGRVDLTPLAAWARARGVRLVEDCAQGFSAPNDHGARAADISLFSFGSIKTMTAFGGALAVVRDPAVLQRMRAAQARWPLQPTAKYAAKVARVGALMVAQRPGLYRGIERLAVLGGTTLDDIVLRAVRGFPVPPGGTLRPLLQFRPSGALLATLRHRLRTFDASALARRAEQGECAHRMLRHRTSLLGEGALARTHWLVAIAAAHRARLVRRGRALGLDLAAGASNIAAVPRPPERPELPALEAERFMSRIVFVPANASVPQSLFERLADLLAMERIAARQTRAALTTGLQRESISLP